MNTLAETLISGEWITSFVVAVITAAGASALAWKKGQAKGRTEKVTITEPVPVLPVQRVYSPPTFAQHQDLVRRVALVENETKDHRDYVESQLRDIRRENSEQFVKLMQAGEVRKDALMASMEGMMRGFHARVDQILDSRRDPKKS